MKMVGEIGFLSLLCYACLGFLCVLFVFIGFFSVPQSNFFFGPSQTKSP